MSVTDTWAQNVEEIGLALQEFSKLAWASVLIDHQTQRKPEVSLLKGWQDIDAAPQELRMITERTVPRLKEIFSMGFLLSQDRLVGTEQAMDFQARVGDKIEALERTANEILNAAASLANRPRVVEEIALDPPG